MTLLFVISHKPDIRYLKRFDVIKQSFDTSVIYWNKDSNHVNFQYSLVTPIEIKVPANKTNPLKRLPETFVFMEKAYRQICQEKPDYLYVGNLDMLYIAAKYKRKNKDVKIIYEIADLHRLIIDKQKVPFKILLSNALKFKEKNLIKLVDLLVLTSMKFYEIYYKGLINKEKLVFMPNMPDAESFNGFKKYPHNRFTVAFVGSIRYKNQLRMLIEASTEADVDILFAGSDSDGSGFANECLAYPNVTFRGEFDYKKEIQEIYSRVDCIYAVYDADMANVRVALPNKLYESVVTEIPIIVAKNTYLSEMVHEMGIGYSVSHKDKAELTEVLKNIKTKGQDYQQKIKNCINEKERQSLNRFNDRLLHSIGELQK